MQRPKVPSEEEMARYATIDATTVNDLLVFRTFLLVAGGLFSSRDNRPLLALSLLTPIIAK